MRCGLEKKYREHLERTRTRNVPTISPEFIDETPYFQEKMQEFIVKAKLQLVNGAGLILLSGPPSTGKSAFLKFIAATGYIGANHATRSGERVPVISV